MNSKEKKVIINYDIEALKRNIERRKKDIKNLTKLIERGAKHPEVFHEEINKAREDIATLKSYIELIEGEKNGN